MDGSLQSVSALSLGQGLSSTSLGRLSVADDSAATGAGAAAAADNGFAATMNRVASNVVDDLRGAEKMAVNGIEGQAGTRQVVDAVMTAQRTLQTALAIRDKIVSAYLEITRMPI